jgi:hypothetical protein
MIRSGPTVRTTAPAIAFRRPRGLLPQDVAAPVAELVTAVDRALGHSGEGVCEAADGNGDGEVSIDEMVDGVNISIGECFTE